MQKAAKIYDVSIDKKISFKGTVQQLSQWLWILIQAEFSLSKFRHCSGTVP
jgi:hypothetical protein